MRETDSVFPDGIEGVVEFRRVCTFCNQTLNWAPLFDEDIEGTFFHISDQTPICEGGTVDVEFKESGIEVEK